MAKRRKNILLVANWPSDVGFAWWLMENYWITIAEDCQPDGIECVLAYPEIREIPSGVEKAPILVAELDLNNRSLTNLLRMWELFRKHRIAIIYFSDYPATSHFFFWLRILGVRRIVVHDHTPGERRHPGLFRSAAKFVVGRLPWINADRLISVTDFVYRRHIEVAKFPERKCSVVPNGIVPIDTDSADLSYAHRIFGIPIDRRIVVMAGRATLYKGVDFFIHCAHQIINVWQHRQFHFLYCGDGPHLGDFVKMVADSDLADYFTFGGRRNDIRELLPSCDVGFHAATGEVGYSLSIIEYMSAGLLTVVPNSPSTAQATIDRINGLVYAPGNVDEACASICKALNSEQKDRITARAVRDVHDKYSLSKANLALIGIIRSVVERNVCE